MWSNFKNNATLKNTEQKAYLNDVMRQFFLSRFRQNLALINVGQAGNSSALPKSFATKN